MKALYLAPLALLASCASMNTETRADLSVEPSVARVDGAECPDIGRELARVDRMAVRVEKLDMRSQEQAAMAYPSSSEADALRHDLLMLDKELLELERNGDIDCLYALERLQREVLEPFHRVQMRH